MGWSCARAAAETLDKVSAACVKSTGSSNTWKSGASSYFFENSQREHNDGAITGSIFRVEGDINGDNPTFRSGTFRINGDGTLARGPAFFRRAIDAA